MAAADEATQQQQQARQEVAHQTVELPKQVHKVLQTYTAWYQVQDTCQMDRPKCAAATGVAGGAA